MADMGDDAHPDFAGDADPELAGDAPPDLADDPVDDAAAGPARATAKRKGKRKKRRKRRCRKCGSVMSRKDRFCDSCGARWLSAEQQRHYRTKIEPAMQRGAKWIGVMGILYVFGGIVYYAMAEDPLVLVVNLVLAAIHAGLWHWAKRSLLPAAVSALVLFVTVHLLNAVMDPATLVQGVVVKVIFLVALARAMTAGLEARRLERGLDA